MENIKLNVATLCAFMSMSTEELAETCGINKQHLVNVRQGRAKMTADDVVALAKATGIPVDNIETARDKQ